MNVGFWTSFLVRNSMGAYFGDVALAEATCVRGGVQPWSDRALLWSRSLALPWRAQAEQRAAGLTDLACPAHGGVRVTPCGIVAGVTSLDRKAWQESQAASQRRQRRMMRHEPCQQIFEHMGSRDGDAKFFLECLGVFLGGMLAQEAKLIMKRLAGARVFDGEAVVLFGLANPFARCLFHKGLSPSSRSPCGITHPPRVAISSSLASGR